MNEWTHVVQTDADRERVVRMVRSLPPGNGRTYEVTIAARETRHSDEQRRLLFAVCADIAGQVTFPGGGVASAEDWKDFLTGLLRGQRMAREGEVVVVIGGGLSGATKAEASEIIDFAYAWGAEHGVQFDEGARA